MSREELATLLDLIPGDSQTCFRFLAATGLRISEAVALQWRHREVPLDYSRVVALRDRRNTSEWQGDDDLVFPASNGAVMSQGNLRRRVLKPAAEEACVSWVGFHAFRHTCASMLFAEGRNAVQVQRWLGHHSPAFTLSVYLHLLDGDIGEPLALPASSNTDSHPSELALAELGA